MPERRKQLYALASYLFVAVVVVGRPLFSADVVSGGGVDLPGTLWMHWWVRTTFQEGTLPIWTDLLFYPDGKNFFNDTGANFLDAYLGIPLQWIFGVPDFLDVLNVLVVAGNAWAFERLARDVNGDNLPAAWGAAVAFEINPYTLQQVDEGRPTQALMWFAILAIRHLLRLDRGTWRDAVLFGVFTVLQGLTYWFTIYFLALVLLPVALVVLARAPRVVAPRLLLAMAVCGAIAAPFLWRISGEVDAGRVTRLVYEHWQYSPVGMSTRWRLLGSQFAQATWIAMFVGAAVCARSTWPWLLGVFLALDFGVGPSLNITTPALENPPFIWLWEHLPFLPRLGFPERIACFGFLALGIAAAKALTRVDVVWAGLLVFVALGEARFRQSLPLQTTAYHFSEANDIVKREGGAIVYLPFGTNEDAMVFQTQHHQPLFGGMGEREKDLRPKGYDLRLDNTFIMMLGATLDDDGAPIGYTAADREAVTSTFRWVWLDTRTHPVSWNALGYDPPGKIRRLSQELGEPVHVEQDLVLWDLHTPVAAPPGLGADAVMATRETREVFEKQLVPAFQTVTEGAKPAPGALVAPPIDRKATPDFPAAPGTPPMAPEMHQGR